MYSSQNAGPLNERSQERIILVKNEPQVVAVKTEPKPEPADPYGLADLDGITDLLPIQTGIQNANLAQIMSQFENCWNWLL